MTETDLTPRQRRFVAAVVATTTVREAARIAGVCERTALRYMRQQAVQAAIRTAQTDILRQGARRAVQAVGQAVASLEAILTDEATPPGVRVSAARAILEHAPKLYETVDLAERVAALEAQIAEAHYYDDTT